MSDSEFESSPEDPWITQDESVSDAFPIAVDVEDQTVGTTETG